MGKSQNIFEEDYKIVVFDSMGEEREIVYFHTLNESKIWIRQFLKSHTHRRKENARTGMITLSIDDFILETYYFE